MPKIGEKHIIKADIGRGLGPGQKELPQKLSGRVTYINPAHRWYLVEADIGDGVVIREGFKFQKNREESYENHRNL